MPRYFLGVDTGATKSHALIADETGRALGFGESGPGNPDIIGYDQLADLLQTIIGQALTTANIAIDQIAGAGFGIAGYDWPSQRQPIWQAIQSLGLGMTPLEFVSSPAQVVTATVGINTGASAG
jgi:N-acetylglucosamine kinase-like BadF-type ATPase